MSEAQSGDAVQNGTSRHVQTLEEKLKAKITEAEDYKNRLAAVEEELKKLQIGSAPVVENKNEKTESNLTSENDTLRQELAISNKLVKEKAELCKNQEVQIAALRSQVNSLREVVSITKDLLNIRTMEVEQLQSSVNNMETKIGAERDRQTAVLEKMARANEINEALKKEYQSQLQLFYELKKKYEEKFISLTKENERLKTLVQNGQ